MTKLRLLLLATTALSAMQFASVAAHAESTPQLMAQAAPSAAEKEKEKKAPPKGQQPPAPPKQPAAPPPAPPKQSAPPPPPHPAAPPPPPAPTHTPPPPPPHPAAPQPPAPAPTPHVTPLPSPTTAPQTGAPKGAAPLPSPTPTAQPQHTLPTPTATPTASPSPRPGGGAEMQRLERQKMQPGETPPTAGTPPAGGPPPAAGATPPAVPPTGGPATAPPGGQQGAAPPPPPGTPPNAAATFTRRAPPQVTAPLPTLPPPQAQALTPIPQGAPPQGPRRMEDFRAERREVQEGGRTVIMEPGRMIIRDPSGVEFVRHDEMDRFRYGARDIRVQQEGGETRTVVIRPDGSEIITVVAPDGRLLRRIRRDRDGREIIIIDNTFRGPSVGFYVDLPPPVIRIPYDRYIVDASDAPPDLIYETMEAPPVERIERPYSLDEIRYSPGVRMLMPSIDVNSINFDTGSWEISPDQAAKLQVIADGLNRAIQRNPREVFLIEGHTDAVGNDTDNLSLSDRRAEAAAELLTQQFSVPAENLTSQGYGAQYLKEQTSGPSRINRRVTVRRITPLLNGGQASLPPPPPGIAPPR